VVKPLEKVKRVAILKKRQRCKCPASKRKGN
jgi:hypothetical protein